MRFTRAVESGLARFADTSGRSSRSAFWWWLLFANVAVTLPLLLNLAVSSRIPIGDTGATWATRLLILVLLVPTATVLVRRLHDTNRSGHWLLLALVPVLGTVALMVVAAMPGTPGPNRYGVAADRTPATSPADRVAGRGVADRVRGLVRS